MGERTHDPEHDRFVQIRRVVPERRGVTDLCFLPDALADRREFIPILTPSLLQIGEDVYSFGSFALGRNSITPEHGYFSGRIVSIVPTATKDHAILLPFPILEGMSGSPVLTYHNGPKLVGVAFGNRSSRILASEVVEFRGQNQELKETIHRIVEFGLAYHSASVVSFLDRHNVTGYVISDQRVEGLGLE